MHFLGDSENEFVEPVPLQNLLVIPAGEMDIDKILEWDTEREAFWVPAVQAGPEYCPQMTHILVKPVNGGLIYIGG